ncbi:MAG TPA: L-aspartate oxidase [Longimicrobiales bacterium]|nr:L-aspartate oxidase [Longimicrobiales bacterium]
MSEPADVLVIGSGVAGLSFALKIAQQGTVTLVTKKQRADSNTNYAQGGIAAVMSGDDDLTLHARDTFVAGAGLCHPRAVWNLVREGPARVADLIDWGVRFSGGERGIALGREGGHSRRRIVHAADRTGREIERALLDALAEHPSVELLEDHVAVDLLLAPDAAAGRRCVGALVLDRHGRRLRSFLARHTLLATGGLGYVYRHTTNPDIATGDGIAMAYRAGARVGNMEFVQFHPTALYPAEGRAVLISEAVRGEGAVLLRHDRTPLLAHHPHGSLATRDIVARSIDAHLKETGAPHVWLDLSPIPEATITERFPNILADCAAAGVDMRTEPVPVVPAAHYLCGGVQTDGLGRTSIHGLLAIGEVALTGVHGANRLASNSLLEAVVFSHRAAEWVALELRRGRRLAVHEGEAVVPGPEPGEHEPDGAVIDSLRDEVRAVMWDEASIVRSDARLEGAELKLLELESRTMELWDRHGGWPDVIELRNLVESALLVVRCARRRPESRGLHHNTDHPYRDNERLLRDTVVVRGGVA